MTWRRPNHNGQVGSHWLKTKVRWRQNESKMVVIPSSPANSVKTDFLKNRNKTALSAKKGNLVLSSLP
jgi:hypothetical protein